MTDTPDDDTPVPKAQLLTVQLDLIDANPFRRLEYPYDERKLAALRRSIAEVGLWPSIIARKAGNRYQIAFGHHRVEAARQSHLDAIPLIVRELTDEQMLQFMGRANMEEYDADFLCMLEIWETASRFSRSTVGIAKLLGWNGSGRALTDRARACIAASALLRDGHLSREALRDLSVIAVLKIATRAKTFIDRLDQMAQQGVDR